MGVRKKTDKKRLRYDKLTDEQKKQIEKLYNEVSVPFEKRIRNIMDYGKWGERWARRVTHKLGLTERAMVEPEEYTKAKGRKFKKTAKRFIITWAQNNTPVHEAFFENLKAYAKHIGAEIHVILGRYKNPTSIFSTSKEEFWDKKVLPYADANRHDIHKHFSILSDIKIQPTAIIPMSGLESVSGLKSCIFGSPKVQMEVIPALEGYKPKIMLTTGSCTMQNYTDSKAGKKSEFHHVFGFCIVEIKDSETFYVRQVTADDNGHFCDLNNSVKNKRISKVKSISSAVLGDIHVGQHDSNINKIQRYWLDKLKPKHTILHDVFDGYSISHHEENDPIKLFQREQDGTNCLKKELDEMLNYIDSMKKYNLVITSANHNDFIDRWIKRVDWKKHIKNAGEYVKYAQILMSGKAPNGIIDYLIRERFGKSVKSLSRNESFSINGWELASHGDIGANGSRGGIQQYSKLNTKMIVAHSHTPSRRFGVLYVGTSTKLRVGYNIGASSWLNADVIVHENGKSQHIIYFNYGFTTLKL